MMMTADISRSPKLIVISAPSGSGKTTIAKDILQKHPEISFSVSATTRPKREYEVESKDYFFLTREQFEDCIRTGKLIEWEEIYGDYYGTLKNEVNKVLSAGKSMLFDIDVKGALSIKQHYPNESVLIFVKPPSVEALSERLKKRKTENTETIQKRIESVPMEMELSKKFDFCIVNDDLETALSEVNEIINNAIASKV